MLLEASAAQCQGTAKLATRLDEWPHSHRGTYVTFDPLFSLSDAGQDSFKHETVAVTCTMIRMILLPPAF